MATRETLKRVSELTHIPRDKAQLVLWGDDESGYANDLFYFIGKELLLVTICMPPGGTYTSSDKFRPIYDVDEWLYVLEGQYTLQNPETGEVRVANAGEMILMRGPQWHYGCNFSGSELRLLESIAPVQESDKLRTVPRPSSAIGADLGALADFPRSREEGHRNMDVVRLDDAINVLLGNKNKTLLRVLGCNDRGTFGIIDLLAGKFTEPMCWSRESSIYVESGHVHVRVDSHGIWQEVGADAAYFVPAGRTWQMFNHRGHPARVLFSLGGNLASELKRQVT